jgi:segregation and condensation protein B
VLKQVGEQRGGAYADFAQLKESEIRGQIEAISQTLKDGALGLSLNEVAGGYRLENDVRCGPWVRELLEKGKPQRLSKPALETLAIIAYRQPCVRSEIEAVRGVAVDQILRNLMELQLVRIVGRSELPGRPMLFGTTQKFLEYFGIRSLDELPGVEELSRSARDAQKRREADEGEQEESQEALESSDSTEEAEPEKPVRGDTANKPEPEDVEK